VLKFKVIRIVHIHLTLSASLDKTASAGYLSFAASKATGVDADIGRAI
jgi:hypothetical protein